MADNIQGFIKELESNGQDVDGVDGVSDSEKLVSAKTALTNFLFFGNTFAHFDNTFVTHIDDFTTHQNHNMLINSDLRKEWIKQG